MAATDKLAMGDREEDAAPKQVRAPAASARPAAGSSEVDERLLQLFWNRAELKKAFSGMRQDREQLLERLREQEAMIARAEDKLRGLEKRLSHPETAYGAIVYYQLRGLWDDCTEQLVRFADELKKQQHDRERKKQIMEFNLDREQRLREVSESVKGVKAESDAMKAVVAGIEAEFAALRGFWNFFKRRTVQQQLDEKRAELGGIRERIEDLFDKRIKIESEPWPEYRGFGVEGRRAINIAVIALAQYLYLQFSDNSLAQMARMAQMKSLREVRYGSKADCEFLMQRIERALNDMHAKRGYADELKARASYVRSRATYRGEAETIPEPTSVGQLPLSVSKGEFGVPVDVNVLADNYWDLTRVLLR